MYTCGDRSTTSGRAKHRKPRNGPDCPVGLPQPPTILRRAFPGQVDRAAIGPRASMCGSPPKSGTRYLGTDGMGTDLERWRNERVICHKRTSFPLVAAPSRRRGFHSANLIILIVLLPSIIPMTTTRRSRPIDYMQPDNLAVRRI